MKKLALTALLVGSAFSASVAMAANVGMTTHVQGGTITINGKVTNNTCHIKDNQGDKVVTLPTVSKNAFVGVGSTAGRTPVAIELVDCAAKNGDTEVKAYFYADDNVTAGGRIKNTDTTTEASYEIQLVDMDGRTPINIQRDGAATQQGQSNQYTTMSNTVTLRYFFEYYALKAHNDLAVGNVTGKVNYILSYK
ncbi:fimbrial protein [Gallibacterium trehalosifermentans]|uniref:Fimbrial protein n=1 Tax=Gallibacterium trehalosifermentans TaxID=516935 RepID=A0ABV6H1A0_9PAST